jgi:lipid-binding SYLF domain-containing protein
MRGFGQVLLLAAAIGAATLPRPALAASAGEINRSVSKALKNLYAQNAAAKSLGTKAQGVLVFPSIVKGGFMVGGQYGEGALRKGDRTVGYYSSAAASYGLQAGLQKFGYALFLMTPSALNYLEKSSGWEIGVGPSICMDPSSPPKRSGKKSRSHARFLQVGASWTTVCEGARTPALRQPP